LENGCVSCHGTLGKGDGPLAAALAPKPTDLSNPNLFKRGSGEAAIARTLADGVMNLEMAMPQMRDMHHELAMPKFDHLTEAERRSIALYVISLHTGRSQP
jgi:mono/diheme cytochrome c family protein